MNVSIFIRVYVYVDQADHACFVMIMGFNTLVDLFILYMKEFDVILTMSWLSIYHVILDCYAKTITVATCDREIRVERYF